jgi:hypothetical protein
MEQPPASEQAEKTPLEAKLALVPASEQAERTPVDYPAEAALETLSPPQELEPKKWMCRDYSAGTAGQARTERLPG